MKKQNENDDTEMLNAFIELSEKLAWSCSDEVADPLLSRGIKLWRKFGRQKKAVTTTLSEIGALGQEMYQAIKQAKKVKPAKKAKPTKKPRKPAKTKK